MTVKLAAPLVRAALDRAVARKGVDYRYLDEHDECDYVDQRDKPSCIVGVVLVDLGVPADAFRGTAMEAGGGRINSARFEAIAHHLPVTVDSTVLKALDEAQTIQDDGGTWGQARDRALAILKQA